MAPVLAAKMPVLKELRAPMDGGRTFRGKRILGANKTWRGLFCGMVAATLAFAAQQYLVVHAGWLDGFTDQADYASLSALLIGPLFAIGVLGGDACKSFIKRRLNVPPGRPWPFFDQVGEIIGAVLVTAPFVSFSWVQYVLVVAIWVVADFLVSALVYMVGWKERPI